ncbi:MAG: GNAT family N-acetyltransferase [Chloroflexota bacterium]|nr:GNAT family N-acetyltransferase [Chloroflexota bacterium]
MKATVRPYRPEDRDAVRRICFLTGYMGDPADWYWRDERSFADVWSSYYTDAEPESLFVADADGRVVGYLLGCVDSGRAWNPVRIGARHAVGRLCLFRPGTAGFLWRTILDVALGRLLRRPAMEGSFSDPRWPSHLHINLLPEARGSGAGRALMTAWLDRLRAVGSPGCHVETLAENGRAIAFFKAMGFERHGEPRLVPGERSREGGRLHGQVLVQPLVRQRTQPEGVPAPMLERGT